MSSATQQTILIADDEPLNIRVLAEALNPDYKVKVATSGKQALEVALSDDTPDLILLDINMPDLDGYEVCRQLKHDDATRNIPIIFVTAQSDLEDEALGLELGAADYIAKPFYLPITLARIKNHLLLKRKTDLLEELVFIDGLTEIANRRHFDQALNEEWFRCKRSGSPLSLAIMDIDHFKLYNDHYGHALGDETLKMVAESLKKTATRPADLIARYGGEEFVAVLPETTLEGACYIGKSFCESIGNLGIPHEASPHNKVVTMSVGVCTMMPTDKTSCELLLDAADKMLYQAKELGRNNVQSTQID